MDPRDLVGQFREARLAAGLTQAGLAARMRTTQTAIARAESGTVTPTLPLLERWSRALDRILVFSLERRAERATDIAPSGVDRDQLRYQLRLTPDARLAGLRNSVRFLARQRHLLGNRRPLG